MGFLFTLSTTRYLAWQPYICCASAIQFLSYSGSRGGQSMKEVTNRRIPFCATHSKPAVSLCLVASYCFFFSQQSDVVWEYSQMQAYETANFNLLRLQHQKGFCPKSRKQLEARSSYFRRGGGEGPTFVDGSNQQNSGFSSFGVY